MSGQVPTLQGYLISSPVGSKLEVAMMANTVECMSPLTAPHILPANPIEGGTVGGLRNYHVATSAGSVSLLTGPAFPTEPQHLHITKPRAAAGSG